MSEKPNPCKLKLVMLFDPRDESCCVCSHNLAAEDARRETEVLREEGRFAFAFNQHLPHPVEDPNDCVACREELAQILDESDPSD